MQKDNRRRRACVVGPNVSPSNRGNHLAAIGWPNCTMIYSPRRTNVPSNDLANNRRPEWMDTPLRSRQPIMVRFALRPTNHRPFTRGEQILKKQAACFEDRLVSVECS